MKALPSLTLVGYEDSFRSLHCLVIGTGGPIAAFIYVSDRAVAKKQQWARKPL